MLYACKGAHTLFNGQTEREREREKEGPGKKKRVRKRDRERERERERTYLFFKEMTGALAPFSYLVLK